MTGILYSSLNLNSSYICDFVVFYKIKEAYFENLSIAPLLLQYYILHHKLEPIPIFIIES